MTGYVKTGIFTNGGPPGISKAFLDNLENFVSYASDTLITTNGSGALTAAGRITAQGGLTVTGGTTSLDGGSIVSNSAGQLTLLTLALTTGTITRISKFSGTAAVGKVTVNHGLGATPDLVILVPNLNTTPSAMCMGVNYSTLTSTQCDIWASLAYNYVAFAVKF